MPEAPLSTGQVAALVARSPATIRRYEASGVIPPANRDPISRRRFWTRAQAESIRRRLMPVAANSACPPESALPGHELGAQAAHATRADSDATD